MNKDFIMNLISDNKTQEALRLLKEHLAKHDLQIEVILLSRRLESLNQKVRLGIIEERERNKEENQINYSIVSLLGKLEFVEYDFSKENEIKEEEKHLPETYSHIGVKTKSIDINEKINIIIPVALIILLLCAGFAIYYFFFKPKPIDCSASLTFRNNVSYIETNSEGFNNLHYQDVSVFAISFEKEKADINNNVWIDVYVEFEMKPNDSMETRADYYRYDPPNLNIDFKKGGEAYILTTFDRFYSLRDAHHIHFKSDTLSSEIVEKIRNNEIGSVSLFNKAFSLKPYPNITLPFENDPNDISLKNLSKNLDCLLKYSNKK